MSGRTGLAAAVAMHGDELPIDVALARALVERDLPQFADQPLVRLPATGSTNVLFRLGDQLLVRLPRQPGNGEAIQTERRWAPHLAAVLPTAVPQIVAVGRPGFGYPEPWSVTRWLNGEPPAIAPPDGADDSSQHALARDLADVVAALRAADVPAEARSDPRLQVYRGRPLAEMDASLHHSVQVCRTIDGLDLDLDAALDLWRHAQRLPGVDTVPGCRWFHGDLVAENLLVRDGRLVAVLDFGAVGVGDPTVDLHGAWELFGPTARAVFRFRLGVDDAQWLRGRAWALVIGLGALAYYWHSLPRRRRDRLAMVRSVLADTYCRPCRTRTVNQPDPSRTVAADRCTPA